MIKAADISDAELSKIFASLGDSICGPSFDAGVYFIINIVDFGLPTQHQVVEYIGSSKNILKRLSSNKHPYRKLLSTEGTFIITKDFGTPDYIEYEKAFIRFFKPRYNKQYVGNGI
jgi:hypothetical protein